MRPMKNPLLIGGAVVALIVLIFIISSINKSAMERTDIGIIPIAHASAIIRWGNEAIYTDPVGDAAQYEGKPEADIVLVTDIHGDHLSTSTLEMVVGSKTVLIVPQAVKDLLPEDLASRARVVANGQSITERGFNIEAIPMYNLPETPNSHHPKGRGNGYVLERDGIRVYVAGDTEGTPEMRALQNINIAFVPMNLPYTMSVEDAANAVLAFKPKQVFPYHYRGQSGLSNVERFKQLVDVGSTSTEVVLLDWYPEQ